MTNSNLSEESFPVKKYIQFKEWSDFGKLTKKRSIYFSSLLFPGRNYRSNTALNILEIGYGNGSFLSFCRKKNYSVVGVEINDDLLQIARNQCFEVCSPSDISNLEPNSFDFVVAFDVFEHMKSNDILNLLKASTVYLKKVDNLLQGFQTGIRH